MDFACKRMELTERCDLNVEFFGEENRRLVRKYFSFWKRKVRSKKEKTEVALLKIEQKEKLDSLVKSLKNHKRAASENEEKPPGKTKELNNYQHRFEAQKDVIVKLTNKLEEKNRVIEDLKLGILREEALRSLDNSKVEIREIFENCSTKVRCKVAPPVEYVEKFMITTQKAPKILQQLEERAVERAKNRELILERKRVIEERRRRVVEEALEKKRVQDEEEKKRNLELMKERRMKELEKEKVRQANKLIFLGKLDRAMAFHNKTLLKGGFDNLLRNCRKNKSNWAKSQLHYNRTVLGRVVNAWKKIVEEKYQVKYQIADALFAKKTLKNTFQIWRQTHVDSIRAMQVAEDFYDLLLQSNVFVHWHRHVCVQIVETDKKMKVAQQYYKRRILFHYFYQWRSLPAVLQLEKAKELKKKKWREKVWEILPDYKPSNEDV